MIDPAIHALLAANAGVIAIAGTRIFPLIAPKNTAAPFVIYGRAGGVQFNSLDGPSGLDQPRIQIDAYAANYKTAALLWEAIRAALDGYSGTVAYTGGTTFIWGISAPEAPVPFFEDDIDPFLYRFSQDFLVTHSD